MQPKRILTLQIVVLALIMGVVTFGAILFFVQKNFPTGFQLTLLSGLGVLLSGAAIVGAVFISYLFPQAVQRRLAGFSTEQLASDRIEDEIMQAFQAKTIIVCALLEGACFFNLVIGIVSPTPSWTGWIVVLGLVLLMATQIPTEARYQNWLRARREAILGRRMVS